MDIFKLVKEILNQEMKGVSDHLDNNIMASFSANIVRQRALEAGVFETPQEALFWFNDNRKRIARAYNSFNKIYRLP